MIISFPSSVFAKESVSLTKDKDDLASGNGEYKILQERKLLAEMIINLIL